MILFAIVALLEGQVAKFDAKQPLADYETPAKMEDVERCLISVLAPPQVYRQPDRPKEVMIVWPGTGLSAGSAAGRVDLTSRGSRTHVRAWIAKSIVLGCAPAI
jgi:hypothetical protein